MKIVILSIFMFWATIEDIKRKKISIKFLIVWFVVSLIYISLKFIFEKEIQIFIDSFLGLLPGIVCLGISYVSREQIGYGDGYVLMLLGMLSGYKSAIFSFIVGLFILSLLSGIMVFLKKADKTFKIPFIPFIFIGYLLTLIE